MIIGLAEYETASQQSKLNSNNKQKGLSMTPLCNLEQEIITVERAIEAVMQHMEVTREEAGRILTKKRNFAALLFIEQTPYGLKYAARPDEEGFYSTEEIVSYFITGQEPDGKNILLLSAKRFFIFLDSLRPLDFDPSLIHSPSDLQIPTGDEEDGSFMLYMDEVKSSAAWRAKAEETEEENKRLKDEILALKQNKPVSASITPGNPLFHPYIYGLAIINESINPPPDRQRDMKETISCFLMANGVKKFPPKSLEHAAWALSSRKFGKLPSEIGGWVQLLHEKTQSQ